MSHRLVAYQIEVLDFSKRNNRHHSDAVIPDTRGVYKCPRCGWEGERQDKCPKCDNINLHPKGMIKVVDTLGVASRRTVMGLFYKAERAKKWGARFGTVISCQKVDKSRYFKNIEHLNLRQEPITIELEQEDFVLNRALELERPRRRYEGEKIGSEIEGKELDKK